MPNRLIHEKSPYLLQHAHNPVDWYPWGEAALLKAGRENKPIFLSIGYATCHWCHVMAHESFEDREVAALLNEHFVSIKVDREERPDLDNIYMSACQALNRSGGWPLSVFMTPGQKPFFAGTYFPKHGRMGMPGFVDILSQVVHLWEAQPDRVRQAGEEVTRAIQPREFSGSSAVPKEEVLARAQQQLKEIHDVQWGGFGGAPKFPTPHHLTFLLRRHGQGPRSDALDIVERTLHSMRRGGIFDQIGLGFHRYSVDQRWLVPHFEKMLYDQAMLSMAYAEAYQLTRNEFYARVFREIFEYVLGDMTDPRGGFHSAEDADSEGQEGKFYVWTPDEVLAALGKEDGDLFCRFYGITPGGNFEEGSSIPHIPKPASVFSEMIGMRVHELEGILESGRQKLLAAREQRIHPLKDDKILTSWNGLMIAALAKGFQASGNSAYLDAAARAADFVLTVLRDDSGRLYRRYRLGEVAQRAYLDDHAFLVWGLIELYEASFDVRYLEEAVNLTRQTLDLFGDEREGGFFFTGKDAESLIVRDKPIYDGAIPSGNAAALLNLLRLGRMTGNTDFDQAAEGCLRRFGPLVEEYPSGYTQFLIGLDFALGPTREMVVVGDSREAQTGEMIRTLHRAFRPRSVLMFRATDNDDGRLTKIAPFVEPLRSLAGKTAVFACENYACRTPVTDVRDLEASLGSRPPT